MPTDKKLKNLVINVMTKDQFESASKNPDELYGVTDATSFTVPDYANGVDLPKPTKTLQTYECLDDGYIIYQGAGFNNGYAYLYINDNLLFDVTTPNNAFYMSLNGALPVRKGDVIKYSSAVDSSSSHIKWYPVRK